MKLPFLKYQGTGNDFVIIDNRNKLFSRDANALVAHLCNRRLGIGADGLMLLQDAPGYDYEMVYYNADGNESTMCGNGGRCLAAFAAHLGLVKKDINFLAIDGPHEAVIAEGKDKNEFLVSLKMVDVNTIEKGEGYNFLNTGSPHYVRLVNNIRAYPVFEEGKKVRYSEQYKNGGTNVNFVEPYEEGIFVRTYERGVEDETLSCGTGVTAAALSAFVNGWIQPTGDCKVVTLGGNLKVSFKRTGDIFDNIWLHGPATFVFKGEIEI